MTGRRAGPVRGLAAFDMDGTLLDGRVIYSAAKEFRIADELQEVVRSTTVPYLRSKKVARLLRGRSVLELGEVVRGISLNKGARSAVERLKELNYRVGIISDSYTLATGIVARKLGLDFEVANILGAKNGILDGSLEMPMGWEKIGCSCRQSVCKQYALRHTAGEYGVPITSTIAVGDSTGDLCMVSNAGTGVWFRRARTSPLTTADNVVSTGDLRAVPTYAQRQAAAAAAHKEPR